MAVRSCRGGGCVVFVVGWFVGLGGDGGVDLCCVGVAVRSCRGGGCVVFVVGWFVELGVVRTRSDQIAEFDHISHPVLVVSKRECEIFTH